MLSTVLSVLWIQPCTQWKLTNLAPNIQHTRLPRQSTGTCAQVVQRGTLPMSVAFKVDLLDITI